MLDSSGDAHINKPPSKIIKIQEDLVQKGFYGPIRDLSYITRGCEKQFRDFSHFGELEGPFLWRSNTATADVF